MENMLFDQSPRSTLDVSLSRSNKSMNSYSSISSSSSSYSPYPSGNSLSHLLYNYNVTAMPKLNSVRSLGQSPTALFSPSLAPSLSLPQPNQPPLLPLPLYKHSSFPAQFNNTVSTPSVPKRKPRATKKERKVKTKNTKIPLERKSSLSPAVDMANDLNDMDEEILIKSPAKDGDSLDCYSISPPPSSLPLPGIALLKPRMRNTAAYNTEAVFGKAELNNASVDNGATDNLRRILRL